MGSTQIQHVAESPVVSIFNSTSLDSVAFSFKSPGELSFVELSSCPCPPRGVASDPFAVDGLPPRPLPLFVRRPLFFVEVFVVAVDIACDSEVVKDDVQSASYAVCKRVAFASKARTHELVMSALGAESQICF